MCQVVQDVVLCEKENTELKKLRDRFIPLLLNGTGHGQMSGRAFSCTKIMAGRAE